MVLIPRPAMIFFALLLIVPLLITPCVSAEVRLVEGYEKIEAADGSVFSIYNPGDFKAIFKAEPAHSEGIISVSYSYANRERELGLLSGTFISNPDSRIIRADDAFFELQAGTSDKLRIKGNFQIVAEKLPNVFMAVGDKGTISHNGFTLFCMEKDCSITVAIQPASVIFNITGTATVIADDVADDYNAGKNIDDSEIMNISNMYGLKYMPNPANQFIFKAMTGKDSAFDSIKIRSRQHVYLQKMVSNQYAYYALKANTATIEYPNDKLLYLSSANTKATSEGIHVVVDGKELFELSLGSAFVFGEKNSFVYDECAGKESSEDEELFDTGSCIFVGNLQNVLAVKPKISKIKLAKKSVDMPLGLTIKEPAVSLYTNITVEGYNNRDARGFVGVLQDEKDKKKKMAFTLSNVLVTKGSWLDFGLSFETYLYDKKTEIYNQFACDANTKECFLDGVKVSGFNEQKLIKCAKNKDCPESMTCNQDLKKCVKTAECTPIAELNKYSPSNPLKVVFISDGYSERQEFINDVKKLLEQPSDGVFSVSPFKENRHKFMFYAVDGGSIPVSTEYFRFFDTNTPSSSHIVSLAKQCPSADQIVVISKKIFRANALYQTAPGVVQISMPTIESDGNGLLLLHEFGHSIGNLYDEYYILTPGKKGSPGSPNCAKTYQEAIDMFGQSITTEAVSKNWFGCGSNCDERCEHYLRPSEKSIMNDQAESNSYNQPSWNQLSRQLSRFS